MSASASQRELIPAAGESPKVDLQANELIRQAEALRDRAADPDIETYYEAVDLDTLAKDLRPAAVAFCADVKKTTHAAWKAAVAQENKILNPIDDTREICRKIMKRWTELEEIASAPAVDPDVQIALEAAREAEVTQLRASGQETAARDLAAQPAPVAMRQVSAPAVTSTPGISYRTVWKGEVEDFDKAVRAIAANPALRMTLLLINQSALDDAFQLSQGQLKIDGINVVKDKTPVNRR